jgi:hypothetical protein
MQKRLATTRAASPTKTSPSTCSKIRWPWVAACWRRCCRTGGDRALLSGGEGISRHKLQRAGVASWRESLALEEARAVFNDD